MSTIHHGKHYWLHWMSTPPSKLKRMNYLPPNTKLQFDFSKVVPDYGKFSPKEIAESFLCYKKRGFVILTDTKSFKVLQAVKWSGKPGSHKQVCERYFPSQRKRSSPRKSPRSRSKRRSTKRSTNRSTKRRGSKRRSRSR